MRLQEAKEGLPVLYTPPHANGDVRHKDCESGVVSSANERFVFVKFTPQIARLGFKGATAQACEPEQLVQLDEALTRIRLNLAPSDLKPIATTPEAEAVHNYWYDTAKGQQ